MQAITVELGWLKRVIFSRDANAQIDSARQLGNCVARKVGVAAVRVWVSCCQPAVLLARTDPEPALAFCRAD